MSYTYDYPMPSITVDIIVRRLDSKFLLIKRADNPHKDKFAVPGGYMEINERLVDAAVRELKEETNITVNRNDLVYIGYFDSPDRDERGRVISHLFCYNARSMLPEAKSGSDAKELGWFDDDEIYNMDLAFDHSEFFDSI